MEKIQAGHQNHLFGHSLRQLVERDVYDHVQLKLNEETVLFDVHNIPVAFSTSF